MNNQLPCKARRINDQMMCSKCGLSWDYNDPDKPVCRTETQPTVVHSPKTLDTNISDNHTQYYLR